MNYRRCLSWAIIALALTLGLGCVPGEKTEPTPPPADTPATERAPTPEEAAPDADEMQEPVMEPVPVEAPPAETAPTDTPGAAEAGAALDDAMPEKIGAPPLPDGSSELDINSFKPEDANTRMEVRNRGDGSGYDISGTIGGFAQMTGGIDKVGENQWRAHGKAVFPTSGWGFAEPQVVSGVGTEVHEERYSPLIMILLELQRPNPDEVVAQVQTEVEWSKEFSAQEPQSFLLNMISF